MRYRLTLAVAAALVGGSSIAAYAQAPAAQAPAAGAVAGFPGLPSVVSRGGGVAGTAIGKGAGAAGQHVPLIIGTGHLGAGTGGIGLGVGNATGGISAATRAGTGGLHDNTTLGSSTGGTNGVGRGLGVGTGGLNDQVELGLDTGGINGNGIGAGTGGSGDLNSLGAGTGGIKEQNAPRFQEAIGMRACAMSRRGLRFRSPANSMRAGLAAASASPPEQYSPPSCSRLRAPRKFR